MEQQVAVHIAVDSGDPSAGGKLPEIKTGGGLHFVCLAPDVGGRLVGPPVSIPGGISFQPGIVKEVVVIGEVEIITCASSALNDGIAESNGHIRDLRAAFDMCIVHGIIFPVKIDRHVDLISLQQAETHFPQAAHLDASTWARYALLDMFGVLKSWEVRRP